MVIRYHRIQGPESEMCCDFICFLSTADPDTRDVKPDGATAPYAAPEVLRSLQLQFEGATPDHPGVLINGPSADWWTTGVVLYELLTGELPFEEDDVCVPREAPREVPESVFSGNRAQ